MILISLSTVEGKAKRGGEGQGKNRAELKWVEVDMVLDGRKSFQAFPFPSDRKTVIPPFHSV